jgi:uncharacterized protein with HEPN domain
MPPTLADRLVHILTAIDTIQRGRSRTSNSRTSPMLRLAIESAFEVICEASRRIPDDVKAGQPDIDWQGMLNFGNRLRDATHRVEPSILWQIARRDLPPLKAFVECVIRESEQ